MDYSALVAAVDLSSAMTAMGSIAAAVFLAYVAIKGIGLARRALA